MVTMSPEKPDGNPLYYAALFGFRDLTARLLAEHPEGVHVKGGHEVTPLHASARRGHSDVFSLLVEHFPNPDIKGYEDQTPLLLASYGGHLEIGKQLLDHGANVNARDDFNWTPLFLAASNGQLAFARMLTRERGDDQHTRLGDSTARGITIWTCRSCTFITGTRRGSSCA